jgi:hypothetical protein
MSQGVTHVSSDVAPSEVIKPQIFVSGNMQRWASATFFWVRDRNSPQLFWEKLLPNRNSPIPQSQFFLKSATWSQFLAYSLRKKIEVKNFLLLPLYGKFLVSRATDSSTNISGCFFKQSRAEEKGLESSGTGRRLRKVAELQKSNFEDLQSLFRNSAIDLVVRNIAKLRT